MAQRYTAEEACEAIMNDDEMRAGTCGASHNLPLNKRLASTISDDEISSPKDPSSDSEVDEPLSDIWNCDPPTIEEFLYEPIGLKIDVSENVNPIFIYKLLLTNTLVDDLVKKTNEYATKLINHNRTVRWRSLWNL